MSTYTRMHTHTRTHRYTCIHLRMFTSHTPTHRHTNCNVPTCAPTRVRVSVFARASHALLWIECKPGPSSPTSAASHVPPAERGAPISTSASACARAYVCACTCSCAHVSMWVRSSTCTPPQATMRMYASTDLPRAPTGGEAHHVGIFLCFDELQEHLVQHIPRRTCIICAARGREQRTSTH
jgi:hypothetical protein